ncbi:hypothetical protein N7468_008338 [Penicillium chermesinum]|uniref:Uncharacterized protein n=1 Tax=Penicillium chermesinum TaxID=63820 RepID=A0A9W9NPV9_9EURO|nr:uncharacterized protein N7468_008338 [Penicillium chermesinum]KAJ5223796.1 hypothetical protein N7468_008338 [Penicillium chermesinum]
MQFTTIATALLSMGVANAAVLGKPSVWKVTDWQIVGSPGGSTECKGVPGNATACADKSVAAKVTEVDYPDWQIWVQHEWHKYPKNQTEQTFWQYGAVNASQFSETGKFDINPTGFYGVA